MILFFLLLYQLIYIILYLYSRIVPFIGENIVKVEELNIKDILLKRVQENKPYSEYNRAIAKFFIWYILYWIWKRF